MHKEAVVKLNCIYTITIIDIGSKGEGIGRLQGLTIFVEHTLPGDVAEVKVIIIKKNYCIGRLLNIITPSPNRVKPPCPVARICGSCQLLHMDYEAQLALKQKKVIDTLERIGKFQGVTVHPTIGMKDPYYYRNKAQFPVGELQGRPALGFYSLRSHELIDLDHCYLQNMLINELLSELRDYIKASKIPIYDERTHTGLLRHVLIRTAFRTGETMVCLVINGDTLPATDELIDRLSRFSTIRSICLNYNTRKGNVILGREIKVIWGADTITEHIGDIQFAISPLSFFQVNPMQTEVLYRQVLTYASLTGTETVWDIYCGIGSITLYLARHAAYVYGIEEVKDAVTDARNNAALNAIRNVQFFEGKAEEVMPNLRRQYRTADTVILDPPRKGCDSELLESIVSMGPHRIVYVSCDPATFARDARLLCAKGYTLSEVQPVDMFPHTVHIETVSLLKRVP